MLLKWTKLFKFNTWRHWLFYFFITGGVASAIIVFSLQKIWEGNQLPVPKIVVSAYTGTAPNTVIFDATASSDPNGKVLSYYWSIDDKFISTQPYFQSRFYCSLWMVEI